MNSYLILAVFCICLMGCSCLFETTDIHCQHLYRVRHDFAQRVAASDGLEPYGSGGGMIGDIQRISLVFLKFENLMIPEVRTLFIAKAEQLLKMMNEDKGIRPYLHDYPAGPKNIKLAISFRKPDNRRVDPPYIGYVSLLNDKIFYSVGEDLTTVLSESYLDALNWVKENNPQALL